MNLKKVKKDKC